MLVTATPRGRTVGQVLQQFWKRAGANMEIEQVDQATIPPRAFMRQFQLTPWRIVDLADPDIADVLQLQDRKPGGARQLLQSGTRQAARSRPHHGRYQNKRIDDYCAITRLINKEAIWFWTFQNTYYAISSAKVKGLPKMYSGVIDVSRAWKE